MKAVEERLLELETEIRALKDKDSIRTLLSEYAVAVDEKNRPSLGELFTEDSAIQIPAWEVDVNGKIAVLEFYDTYWSRFNNPRRYFANESFTMGKDDAQVFMYWHVTQDSENDSYLGWGTYHWRFKRFEKFWKIAAVQIDILAMTTLAAGWAGKSKFV